MQPRVCHGVPEVPGEQTGLYGRGLESNDAHRLLRATQVPDPPYTFR